MWVIVITALGSMPPPPPRVVGLFTNEDEAERVRRNLHMDHVLAGTWRPPASHVIRVESS